MGVINAVSSIRDQTGDSTARMLKTTTRGSRGGWKGEVEGRRQEAAEELHASDWKKGTSGVIWRAEHTDAHAQHSPRAVQQPAWGWNAASPQQSVTGTGTDCLSAARIDHCPQQRSIRERQQSSSTSRREGQAGSVQGNHTTVRQPQVLLHSMAQWEETAGTGMG